MAGKSLNYKISPPALKQAFITRGTFPAALKQAAACLRTFPAALKQVVACLHRSLFLKSLIKPFAI